MHPSSHSPFPPIAPIVYGTRVRPPGAADDRPPGRTSVIMSPEITKHNGNIQSTAESRCRLLSGSRPSHLTWPSLPTVSVVVPAMNEAENLPHVFATLPAVDRRDRPRRRQLVDDTVAVARRLRPNVSVVHPDRQGQGRRAGRRLRRVHRRHHRDDRRRRLHRRPARSSTFVGALVTGADFVKGSRYAAGGGSDDLTSDPPVRQQVAHRAGQPDVRHPATPTSATATTPSGPATWTCSTSTATASRSRP